MAALAPAWRPHVARALAARDRLDRLIAGAPPGPVRERLTSIAPGLDTGVATLLAAAERAAALAAAVPSELATRHLAELKEARRALAAAADAGRPTAELEAHVAALAARHAATQRVQNELEDLPARARLLALRIEAAVTHAAAVVLAGGPDLAAVEAEVQGAIDGLVALRAGLDEVEALSRSDPGPAKREARDRARRPAAGPEDA
jgi:hypothetical protein